MENDRTTRRVFIGECTGSRLDGRPRNRQIDIVKDSSKKRGLDVRQAGRMVHHRSVWRGFVRRNALDVARRMNP